jgi:hypothetical protein
VHTDLVPVGIVLINIGILDNLKAYEELEDKKVCKVCDPNHKPKCRLSDTSCPYRDIDTLS